MSFEEKFEKVPDIRDNQPDRDGLDPMLDPALQNTLRDFRLSVHAWSEAAYSRPHRLPAPRQRAWRSATAWALGCVLAVGAAVGGVRERQHQQELARIAAVHAAEQQRRIAEQHALDAEDLLAKVDQDISRQVPSAMEPLARLMADDGSQ